MRIDDLVPGCTYRIRQWDDMDREFGVLVSGTINTQAGFVRGMLPLCGTTLVWGPEVGSIVTRITDGGGVWAISADMLEPISAREQIHDALVKAGLVCQ
jgi:hypothetical protein